MSSVTKANAIDILKRYVGCHEASDYLCATHPACSGCPYSYDYVDMHAAISVALDVLEKEVTPENDNAG